MMAAIYVVVQFLAEGVDFWLAIWGLSFVDGAESPVSLLTFHLSLHIHS